MMINIDIKYDLFFLHSFAALDLASQSNVQDAFVIAVEQQARERLEKLSALKKIKPVDMTKLSHQVTNKTFLSGIISSLQNLCQDEFLPLFIHFHHTLPLIISSLRLLNVRF